MTVASVFMFITITCIITFKAAMDWEIHQINVKMTLLNEIFEMNLYWQPEDFV